MSILKLNYFLRNPSTNFDLSVALILEGTRMPADFACSFNFVKVNFSKYFRLSEITGFEDDDDAGPDDDAAGKPKCCLCISIAASSSDTSAICDG